MPHSFNEPGAAQIIGKWLIASIYSAETALPVDVIVQRYDSNSDGQVYRLDSSVGYNVYRKLLLIIE